MHKGVVAAILLVWVIILCVFAWGIGVYALNNHLGIFEALKKLDLDLHILLIGHGILTPLFFIILYTIRPLLFFPASIMTITSVFIFGPYEGFVVSYIGETASACLAYYVGKYFGHEFGVTKKVLSTKIGHYFQGNTFLSIFVLRIVPLFPFDFVNYASGVFKIPFKQYFWATVLGVLPGLAVFIFLGNALINQELLPIAIASCIALILIGFWLKEKYEV